MTIQLATISSDPLKLDKRGDFQAANPVSIAVKISQPCNTENPSFTLEISGVFSYNYAYVEKWDKYYFLGEPTYLDGNRLTVSGVCDVLTSNADEIKDLTINVRRSAGSVNKMIPDNARPIQANRQCETIEFKDSFSPVNFSTDTCYVLSVMGGAHS